MKEHAGFYVYIYYDPRDGVPFYVGKGQGYRARVHSWGRGHSRQVSMKIKSLRAAGLEPLVAIVDMPDEAAAFDAERTLILGLGRRSDGGPLFNISEGGQATLGFGGRKHTEETKARISATLKGRVVTAEHRAKIGAANKGRPGPSPEHQAAMYAARTTPEGRKKLSDAAKRSVTPERLAAMTARAAEVNRGKTLLPHVREALRAACTNRVISEESRQRMSAAQKRRYAK